MYTNRTLELCDRDGHPFEVVLSDLDPVIPIVYYELEGIDAYKSFALYFKSGISEYFRVDQQNPENMAVLEHTIETLWKTFLATSVYHLDQQ